MRLLKGSLGEFLGGKPNLDLVLRFSSDQSDQWYTCRPAPLSGFGHPRIGILDRDLGGISVEEALFSYLSHPNGKVAIVSNEISNHVTLLFIVALGDPSTKK